MNSTIQASFFYSHFNNNVVEDTHFKSIIRLKSSTPESVLEDLFFNMANNQVNISKEYITTYLNKYIATNFFNEDFKENTEDHIIRHNDNFLLFTFDKSDDSIEIKYLAPRETEVHQPELTVFDTIKERGYIDDISYESIENTKKEKKSLLKSIFKGFKKNNKKKEKAEA